MALSATIRKVELQISDLDRNHYASHSLTLAQHPSETDERLVARVLAFVLYADERLAFGRGLSTEDEPDLWRRDYSGQIEQWIELGQPDESRLRKAAGRAREVVVVGYSGRAFELWWDKNAAGLARLDNLTVLDVSAGAEQLAALLERNMDLQCLVQDGQVQWSTAAGNVEIAPVRRQSPTRA